MLKGKCDNLTVLQNQEEKTQGNVKLETSFSSSHMIFSCSNLTRLQYHYFTSFLFLYFARQLAGFEFKLEFKHYASKHPSTGSMIKATIK